MNSLFACNQPLKSIFWSVQKRSLDLLWIVSGIAFLALTAQIVIPLQPVPLTLQSATVILLSMAYGLRLSLFTVLGYLILGGIGLPIFAGMSSGMSVLTGSTAGYLLGFFVAAGVTGFLAERGYAKHLLSAFFTACLGSAIIFLCGVLVLSQFVGWEKAFLFGVAPFILTEPLKLLAISCIVPRCWKTK